MPLISGYTRIMTVKDWLKTTALQLKQVDISSYQLDAEVLLAHLLQKSRTFLHAHNEIMLQSGILKLAEECVALRKKRVPLAYIVGHKEFYGRLFQVTPDVLIPRPESEMMIELLKQYHRTYRYDHIFDIGTGSGCLAITAKCELPHRQVIATDISHKALTLAQKNAHILRADVTFHMSDLLMHVAIPKQPVYVLANLPYVSAKWNVSPETAHEPRQALFADNNGYYFVQKLFIQAEAELARYSIILIEADKRQHDSISVFAHAHDFKHLQTKDLILCFIKDQP